MSVFSLNFDMGDEIVKCVVSKQWDGSDITDHENLAEVTLKSMEVS